MIINATDAQVTNMTRSAPPTAHSSTQASSLSATMDSQNGPGQSGDAQNQLIQKFSQESGMNMDYSKLFVFIFDFQNIYLLYLLIIAVCWKMNGITIKLHLHFKNYKKWFVVFFF